MTDDTDRTDRLDRLESLVERQQETIDALRAQVDGPGEHDAQTESDPRPAVSRRTALKTGGLAGLLALGAGAGTASADPSGQVGTNDDPLNALYTEALDGPLTDDNRVESLVGDALAIEDDTLSIDAGGGLDIVDGTLVTVDSYREPDDLDAMLDGMIRDNDGTYVITDAHELQAMNADPEADYRLGKDIDARVTSLWNGGDGFDPIGDLDDMFVGTFDGDGHVVGWLAIDREDEDYVGLFGRNEGTIENVGLVDVDVTGSANVGGLVGSNGGDVTDAYVTGDISGNQEVGGLVASNLTGGVITDTYVTGGVSGDIQIGGLVGSNGGNVTGSYATGDVSGDDNVGGLVGANDGDVTKSYATGDVSGDRNVGGLVGLLVAATGFESEVLDSYATGDVSGNERVGGLVGRNNGGGVTDSYWDEEASGVADGIGDGSGDATGLDTDEMQGAEEDLDDGLVADFDFDDTWATVTDPDDYPVLQAIDEDEQLEARE